MHGEDDRAGYESVDGAALTDNLRLGGRDEQDIFHCHLKEI
jgi:hypothetical protein